MRRALRWIARALLGLLVLVVLLLTVSTIYGRLADRRAREAHPPPGRLVEADGHALHVHCSGEGSPTVLLEAGLGDWSLAWRAVQPILADSTQVCSYDRAGLGWSEPGPTPRDGRRIARELRALLREADLQGPFVLVGHSAGGMYARIFTDLYRDVVAGLVLVDAPTERDSVPPYRTAMIQQARAMSWMADLGLFHVLGALSGEDATDGASFLPPYVSKLVPEDHQRYLVRSLHSFDALAAEWSAFDASLRQLRACAPLRDLPVVVLRSRAMRPPEPRQEHAPLPALPPETTYRRAERSGHYVQFDQPALVVDAVRQVMVAAQ